MITFGAVGLILERLPFAIRISLWRYSQTCCINTCHHEITIQIDSHFALAFPGKLNQYLYIQTGLLPILYSPHPQDKATHSTNSIHQDVQTRSKRKASRANHPLQKPFKRRRRRTTRTGTNHLGRQPGRRHHPRTARARLEAQTLRAPWPLVD